MISTSPRTQLFPNRTLRKIAVSNELYAYESFDHDPFFEVIPEKIIKAGWYFISYKFQLKSGKILLPKVYFDFGEGYSENYHWKLFYNDNMIFGLVKVPWNCIKLRLDLSEDNILFEPGKFEFKRINKIQASLKLFPILNKLGHSRSEFLKVLMSHPKLSDKKKVLKSLYEGNYSNLDYHQIPHKPVSIMQDHHSVIAELLKYSSINRRNYEKFFNQRIDHKAYKENTAKIDCVDILLPVYNGYEYLTILIPQIIERSDIPFKLFIINDCSTDERVMPFLNEMAEKHPQISLEQNEQNLGFTKTVNKLIIQSESDIIVLLNSDIEVPFKWLSKLIFPLTNDTSIGTITPMSNCATICSFPNMGDNLLLENNTVQQLNNSLEETGGFYEEIPTGVGFCMVINRLMLRQIGILNEEAFPRGYGEEVDLCFRGRKAGYKNIINTSLFVYHKHGGSFDSAEKMKLMNENQQKLEQLHPDFSDVLQNYFRSNAFIIFKVVFLLKLIAKEGHLFCLFLDHDLGGGTNQYSKNYQQGETTTAFINGHYINPNRNSERQILFSLNYKNYHLKFGIDDLQILFDLLDLYKIELETIIVNNLVSYSNATLLAQKIKKYKKEHPQTMLKVLGHDFFYICPNFLLFKDNADFCGIPDDLNICNGCLKNLDKAIDPKLVPNDFKSLPEWRSTWGQTLIQAADEIIVFSESTEKLFLKVWPDIKLKTKVVPHKLIGFKKETAPFLNIGILGHIHSAAKGARIVYELADYVQNHGIKNLNLMSFGGINPNYDHFLIDKKGFYNLDNLHALLLKHKVDVILIPSICSETFSFTTKEAIETGLPTACFALGGQYDQVKKYQKGIILNEMKPEVIIQTLFNYFNEGA